MFTNKEMQKEIRGIAKSVGLTFKVDTKRSINGAPSYVFTDRKTGEIVLSNCTLSSAYANCCNGFIQSWNGSVFYGAVSL